MLIGSLEEISYRMGILTDESMMDIAETAPYGDYLKRIVVNHKSVEE